MSRLLSKGELSLTTHPLDFSCENGGITPLAVCPFLTFAAMNARSISFSLSKILKMDSVPFTFMVGHCCFFFSHFNEEYPFFIVKR